MVIKERTLIVGAAVAVALMVGVVLWRQVTALARSAPAAGSTAAFSPERVQTISSGEEVNLVAHMPETGRTVVEFTADWFPGCRQLGPQVEAWTLQQTDGTRLLRVDIDSWSSDVATQYGIRSLPTLYLFEGKRLVLTDTRAVLQRLEAR